MFNRIRNFINHKSTKNKPTQKSLGFSGDKGLSVWKDIGNLFMISVVLLSFVLYISANYGLPSLAAFVMIGPLRLGITSLVGLITLYGVTGYLYNKGLSDSGGGIDGPRRVGLILVDLGINLALGMYYMQHRETLMGIFMLRCPIAISPLIFILELICVYGYHRYYEYKKQSRTTANSVQIKKTPTDSSSTLILKKALKETTSVSKEEPKDKDLSKEEPKDKDLLLGDKELLKKEDLLKEQDLSMLSYFEKVEKRKEAGFGARGKPPVRPK